MFSHFTRTAIAAAYVLLSVTGCGSSGGSSSTASGATTIRIVTDADALAFQQGNEAWRDNLSVTKTLADGQKEYDIAYTGRYGVALHCTQQNYSIIFQLDTSESSTVPFRCDQDTPTAQISGTATDTTDTPDGIAVAMGRDYDITASNGATYTMSPQKGLRDLVAVPLKKDSNGNVIPLRFHIERGISFTGPDLSHNITLTAANTTPVSGYLLQTTANTTGEALLITANDTFFTAAIDGKWYLPQSGLIDEDLFVFVGTDTARKVAALDISAATAVTQTDKTLDVSYINTFAGVTYDNSATFANVHYNTTAQNLPLRAYLIQLEENTGSRFEIVLSSKWAGDTQTYTIPNLSTLNGFQKSWLGAQAKKAEIRALMSNRTIGEMFTTKRYLNLYESALFLLPDTRYEVAAEEIF